MKPRKYVSIFSAHLTELFPKFAGNKEESGVQRRVNPYRSSSHSAVWFRIPTPPPSPQPFLSPFVSLVSRRQHKPSLCWRELTAPPPTWSYPHCLHTWCFQSVTWTPSLVPLWQEKDFATTLTLNLVSFLSMNQADISLYHQSLITSLMATSLASKRFYGEI